MSCHPPSRTPIHGNAKMVRGMEMRGLVCMGALLLTSAFMLGVLARGDKREKT